MTSDQLRQKYLDFFQSKNHALISGASLIPENDPTVLFTTAGMHPLVPYLMGTPHPSGQRLTSAQKCIRTGDIDEVGDATHHTFFEMMGNWSLGDYFKKESIAYSWEFLTDPAWLGLDSRRLAVSVFAGDEDAPFDEESFLIWQGLGIPAQRIARLPKKNNWWGPAGATGPCGPDTEIFYWTGDPNNIPESFNDDNVLWVEIWNNVFMEYNKNASGAYEALSQKNVDTGLGLERMTAVMSGLDDNYLTDLFRNLIAKLEELSGRQYGSDLETTKLMRIISDHLKAATFIIGDEKGVSPSNTDQGYVVRRLIRRAVRYGRQLGISQALWTKDLALIVISDYKNAYPELTSRQKFILDQLSREEEKFITTLEKGLKILDSRLSIDDKEELPVSMHKHTDSSLNFKSAALAIDGQWAFDFYQSYGFPLEMLMEELDKRHESLDGHRRQHIKEQFDLALKKHQDLSRTAAAGKFKGGLADGGEETTKLHTATHLLLAALRKVLGDHVYQRGSNITPERLRLDFSHPEKMSADQIKQVEDIVNEAISRNYPVTCQEMSLSEAKNSGAMGVFDSKYGEMVTVYTIGPLDSAGQPDKNSFFSKELCGGPHVNNIGPLGQIKISKEEASSSGVRRIKAVLL